VWCVPLDSRAACIWCGRGRFILRRWPRYWPWVYGAQRIGPRRKRGHVIASPNRQEQTHLYRGRRPAAARVCLYLCSITTQYPRWKSICRCCTLLGKIITEQSNLGIATSKPPARPQLRVCCFLSWCWDRETSSASGIAREMGAKKRARDQTPLTTPKLWSCLTPKSLFLAFYPSWRSATRLPHFNCGAEVHRTNTG
jgi:hypothetical protein